MKKLTIVKVLDRDTPVSDADLERWRQLFEKDAMTPEEMDATGEVSIEYLNLDQIQNQLMLVRIGGEDYKPSVKDLETWREIFEEASTDPDFKIFTHQDVDIQIFDIGKIVHIE